ncbi:MAG: permease [Synergistaceae bacterium]|jgi:uncharacterized membrane protein YraQ (UPF0718 family)|nr:permease [Synergistaceae bacterium]
MPGGRIPVFVVTGFLDSGKTTLLNDLLNRGDWGEISILVAQFESGEVDFHSKNGNCENIVFPKKMLDTQPEEIVRRLAERLADREYDEIWIEWNGVAALSRLYDIVLHRDLRKICEISRIAHVVDAGRLEPLISGSGGALLDQIGNSDFAVVRDSPRIKEDARLEAVRLLRAVNPGIRICGANSYNDIHRSLFRKKRSQLVVFSILTVLMALSYLAAKPLLEANGVPINKVVNVFLGITLQAVPFLLIGVHLSAAIEIFVDKAAIERRFPKTVGAGMAAAVAAGFCLPVCDCASIPIFRSLLRKGVPLPVAITFLMSAPVTNPVVILSTYYAFGGNLRIVAGRVFLGVVSAAVIGLLFALGGGKSSILKGGAFERISCSCGCWEDAAPASFSGRLGLFFRHAQTEFFSAAGYLIVGIFISSLLQSAGGDIFSFTGGGAGLAASMAVMMAAGFVLSLCSSSDAVVARSFASQFPAGAVMAFLVFGPMMDIKNFMMLSYGFTRSFILKLSAAAFLVSFSAVFAFSSIVGW